MQKMECRPSAPVKFLPGRGDARRVELLLMRVQDAWRDLSVKKADGDKCCIFCGRRKHIAVR